MGERPSAFPPPPSCAGAFNHPPALLPRLPPLGAPSPRPPGSSKARPSEAFSAPQPRRPCGDNYGKTLSSIFSQHSDLTFGLLNRERGSIRTRETHLCSGTTLFTCGQRHFSNIRILKPSPPSPPPLEVPPGLWVGVGRDARALDFLVFLQEPVSTNSAIPSSLLPPSLSFFPLPFSLLF